MRTPISGQRKEEEEPYFRKGSQERLFQGRDTVTDLVNEKEPVGGRAGRRAHVGEGSARAKALRYEWREGQSDER